MAHAYEEGDCLCGAIFGTGTNGAYVESMHQIKKMGRSEEEAQKHKESGLEQMIINTECESLCLLLATCLSR